MYLPMSISLTSTTTQWRRHCLYPHFSRPGNWGSKGRDKIIPAAGGESSPEAPECLSATLDSTPGHAHCPPSIASASCSSFSGLPYSTLLLFLYSVDKGLFSVIWQECQAKNPRCSSDFTMCKCVTWKMFRKVAHFFSGKTDYKLPTGLCKMLSA